MLMCRLHWSYCRLNKLSGGGQLYIDLVAAFASIARELSMCQDRSDEAAAAFLQQFDMPPEALDQVRYILGSEDALQMVKCGGHIRAFIEAAHEPSWFTMQGDFLGHDVQLPKLEKGDIIVVHDCSFWVVSDF